MEILITVIVCMAILFVGTVKVVYDCRKLDTVEDNPYSLIDHKTHISYV